MSRALHFALSVVVAFLSAVGTRADVVINEIHYDPADETSPEEFIELYNSGAAAVDLGGAYFDAGVSYAFPAGTTIAAGGYLVVAQAPVTLLTKFGATALGPYTNSLDGGGEQIRLRSAVGVVLDEVTFSDHFPWPTLAGGGGSSMELLHPGLDNDLGGSWRSSSTGVTSSPSIFIPTGSSAWRYRKGTSEPPSNWRATNSLMDATWLTGTTSIGYGDNDDATVLSDMQNGYTTVYLRHDFVVTNISQILGSTVMNLYVDDGAILWINGVEVARRYVSAGDKAYTDIAASSHEAAWEVVSTNIISHLVVGTNTLAVMVLNFALNNSDLSFNLELKTTNQSSVLPSPTPGKVNSVVVASASAAPPSLRQVDHSPKQPAAGQAVTVTAKVTDADAIGAVALLYQVVEPGTYLPAYIAWTPTELITDPYRPNLPNPAFEAATNWTEVVMHDDGLNGDALAGDSIYSVVMPGSLQQHRRLIRYRIKAVDALANSIRVPYADDPSLNFAYFCYNGVPAWSGAIQPGVAAPDGTVVAYDTNVMSSLPTYHLISKSNEVEFCQYYNFGNTTSPSLAAWNWQGTFVYDGEVYDHIRYRNRGWSHPYTEGKNKWKFDFNRGKPFEARDDTGKKFSKARDKVNFLSCYSHRISGAHPGEEGMIVAANSRLFNLVGVPTPETHFVQFRVIDEAAETNPTNQYVGDFWGLYLLIEDPDGRFLDEHDLPNGNLYKMNGAGTELNNQGPTQPNDGSDLDAFTNTLFGAPSPAWLMANTEITNYFSYRTICEAVHHFDLSKDSNHLLYHRPDVDRWCMLPWDFDLSWSATIYSNDAEKFKQSLSDAAFNIEYKNRVREIRDLLFNADQGAVLIDELASYVRRPGTNLAFVDADRAMWDYHPRGNFPGQYWDFESGGSFAGVVARMKTWMDGGWGGARLDAQCADADIPNTPTISYTGTSGYPVNGLQFNCSAFSDPQGNGTFAAMQWRVGEIIDTNAPAYDPTDFPPYEITPKWTSGELASFNATMAIPVDALKVGHTYRARVRLKDNTGRWSNWSAPVQFTCTAPTTASALLSYLRISEVMYNPTPGSDFEFIELHNSSTNLTLDLGGAAFTAGVTYTIPAGVTIAPNGYLLVIAHASAATFRTQYGLSTNVAVVGPYSGKLDNSGEQVTLKTAAGGAEISSFTYKDSRHWPLAADGAGHSLVPVTPDATGQATGALDYPGNWRASTFIGGSPGQADPQIGLTVRLNEIVAHTDYVNPSRPEYDSNDWIELFNTTGTNISLGGWYLSDDPALPSKWAIPAVNLPANGRVVFAEVGGFHDPITTGFGLDKAGEQVLLSYLPGDVANRVVDAVGFSGQENGRSLSRYSDGGAWWYVTLPSSNSVNTAPVAGLRISEFMYQPPLLGTNDNTRDEFIEIYNPTVGNVTLQNASGPWRLDGGVTYTFPTNTVLASGQSLLVVSFAPSDAASSNAFRSAYGITNNLRLFGPYTGKLANRSDFISLEKPQDPDVVGDPYSWVLEDEVVYGNQSPWPSAAAGGGSSLKRVSLSQHGCDSANWTAVTPTPGQHQSITTTSPQLAVQFSSSQLQLAWPATHVGWRLEAQTNSLTTGLSANWFAVSGSAVTNQVFIPIDQVSGSVFFRLVYP